MSTNSFTPKAEFLWFSIAAAHREQLLRNVWCRNCRTAVEIIDFAGKELRGNVVLEGRCRVCSARGARLVETAQARIPPD